MISKVKGKLVALDDDLAVLAVDSFEYQVLIPDFTRRQLQSMVGQAVSLHTLQYLEGNPTQGRLIPRLVGFYRPVEREFFELFCSVDGVGMRKALRAMVRPVQDVAGMIEEQDAKGLSTLPGIGPATAERVIAKLRRKMSRFALLITNETARKSDVKTDVVQDCFAALIGLGHSESDARHLIDAALARKKKFKDLDALLVEIYNASKAG